MATSDRNVLITPNTSTANYPNIKFTGSNNTPTYLRVLDDGTLSFEGNSSGQVFSISDGLTGTIFSVNDAAALPMIEVLDVGTIKLAPFGGNVGIGNQSPNFKLDVTGAINYQYAFSDISPNTVAYTPNIYDQNKVVIMNSGSPQTFTIPTNANVPYPIGTQITVIQGGSGQITFTPTSITTQAYTSGGASGTASVVVTTGNTSIAVGQLITGTGIATGTQVTGVAVALSPATTTSITLDTNTTAQVSGTLTFSTGLFGTPGLKTRTKWSAATLIKRYVDGWILIGDLSS